MKLCVVYLVMMVGLFLPLQRVHAQSEELQQLILDIQKLNQLRAILTEMKQGYEILTKGYNTVKDLTQGNFNLHKNFLDALLEVSPTVKKYKRIADIILLQESLISEYKQTLSQVKNSQVFSGKYIDQLQNIYDRLVDQAADNLDELLMVVTAGQMRMNDAERLSAIDRIYTSMQDKLGSLRKINASATTLLLQKQAEQRDIKNLQELNEP